jgi:undecaprenyl pyrophosphate phosphatase UppP
MRRSAWIFVWYRLIFGIGIVVAVLGGHLHD